MSITDAPAVPPIGTRVRIDPFKKINRLYDEYVVMAKDRAGTQVELKPPFVGLIVDMDPPEMNRYCVAFYCPGGMPRGCPPNMDGIYVEVWAPLEAMRIL